MKSVLSITAALLLVFCSVLTTRAQEAPPAAPKPAPVADPAQETPPAAPKPAPVADPFTSGMAAAQPVAETLKVFSLQHLDAQTALSIVSQLFGRDSFVMVVDVRGNSLIARGNTAKLAEVEALLLRLDSEASGRTAPGASLAEKQHADFLRAKGYMSGRTAPGTSLAEAKRPTDVKSHVAQPANAESHAANYLELEKQAAQTAAKCQQFRAKHTDSHPEAKALKDRLRQQVSAAFEARQQWQNAELVQLRARLAAIEQSLAARQRVKDTIINRRVEQLLEPDLQWEPADRKRTLPPSSAAAHPGTKPDAYPQPGGEPIVGILGYDESRMAKIHSRLAGRVGKVLVNFVGTRVERGNALVELEEVEKQTERTGRHTVFAPMTGIVVEKKVEAGERVEDGTHMLTIADPTHLHATFFLPISGARRLRVGQRFTLSVDGLTDGVFPGEVVFIDATVQANGEIKVVATVANEQAELKPGMQVRTITLTRAAATSQDRASPLDPVQSLLPGNRAGQAGEAGGEPRADYGEVLEDRILPDGSRVTERRTVAVPVEPAFAARRTQAFRNLHQIASAMLNHHDVQKAFPPAYQAENGGKPLLSWRVLILPYLGQGALYREFHLAEPWDSEHNKKLIERMPAVYCSPGSKAAPGMTNYLTVRGPNTAFPGKDGVSLEQITDGTSWTILVVEASDEKAVVWTKPVDIEYDETRDELPGLVGLQPKSFLAAFCDGSLRELASDVDSKGFKKLFLRNDGPLEGPFSTLPLGGQPLDAITRPGGQGPSPAAQPDSDPAAQRRESIRHLKHVGLAMHEYHDVNKTFPPAYQADNSGKPLLSWRVLILPYLGQEALYREFHLTEPWDSEHNKKLIERMPAVYRSPGSKSAPTMTNYLTVHGPNTAFPGKDAIGMAKIFDGTSNVIMVVEASDQKAVVWTKPDDFEYNEADPLAGLIGLRSDGFLAALCDGAAVLVPSSVEKEMLRRIFIRDDGLPVPHPIGKAD
jgi:biotin carboxyl carrier protein